MMAEESHDADSNVRFLSMRERRFMGEWELVRISKPGDTTVTVNDGTYWLQANGPAGFGDTDAIALANELGFPIAQEEEPREE